MVFSCDISLSISCFPSVAPRLLYLPWLYQASGLRNPKIIPDPAPVQEHNAPEIHRLPPRYSPIYLETQARWLFRYRESGSSLFSQYKAGLFASCPYTRSIESRSINCSTPTKSICSDKRNCSCSSLSSRYIRSTHKIQ